MTTQQTSTQKSSGAPTWLYPSLALTGKAGAGKDTVAQVLRELYPVYSRVAFADILKDVGELIWGESARTNRGYLQDLGVKVREIDEDAWVSAAFRDNEGRWPIVITDMRFQNEYRACVALDLVVVRIDADRGIRLNRLRDNGKLEDESQLDHISETALDGIAPNYVITNETTLEYVGERLRTIIEHERSLRG